MTDTTGRPQAARATAEPRIGAGGAPAIDRRPGRAVLVAEGALAGCGFVLAGFVVPFGGIGAGVLLLAQHRRARAAQVRTASPGEGLAAASWTGFEPGTSTAPHVPAPRRSGEWEAQHAPATKSRTGGDSIESVRGGT